MAVTERRAVTAAEKTFRLHGTRFPVAPKSVAHCQPPLSHLALLSLLYIAICHRRDIAFSLEGYYIYTYIEPRDGGCGYIRM